jgi:hypothetical protein
VQRSAAPGRCGSIPRDCQRRWLYGDGCETELPPTIYQPTGGLYRAVKFQEEGEQKQAEVAKKLKREKIREEDFYDAFGDWLINELEECTKATSLGGNRFKDKWGTPDVIGVREAKRSDIIKPPTEIISAEIKLDPANLITAFGQACSYKLFSHKSYIVVPNNSSEDDIASDLSVKRSVK